MKFLIFDIDGTLTDTKRVEDKCFMKAFHQTFNIDIRELKWNDFTNVTDWGITKEIVEKELGRKPQQTEYELMISNFITLLSKERDEDSSQFKEVNGAKYFFYELLRMEEYKIGIATGCWEESAKIKLDAIGIQLNGICFSNSNFHKSREAITKDVIRQLKSKAQETPKQIIYFGDGEWDLKTCKNLGIKFIGIDINGDGKLNSLGAETVFKNYENKTAILDELKKTV